MGRCVRPSWQRHKFGGSREKSAVWGQPWRAVGFPDLPGGFHRSVCPPGPPFISSQSYTAPSPLLSHEVTGRLPAEEQRVLGRQRPF